MRTIICLGHAALDRIYRVPHLPHGSTKVRALDFGEAGGGMAANALVPLADHAIFSEPGLSNWFGRDDMESALRAAVAAGARIAGVTQGEKGATMLVDGALHHVPAVPVQVVDTLGAGDIFHGAYALALAEGKTVLDAVCFASAAAAIKCSRQGGRAGSPTRREVEDLLRT